MAGPYKVGCTSNVTRRVRALSNASPFPLELVCRTPGDVVLERRMHAFLRRSHSRCEWFDDCAEIHALISAIKAGSIETVDLPEPLRIDSLVRGQTAAQRREPKADAA